jgi:hypothetical protein
MTSMDNMLRGWGRRRLWLAGLCVVVVGFGLWVTRPWTIPGIGDRSVDPASPVGASSLLRSASADLEQGDYEFYPNRRSVWVVNRTNGRMANYQFRDDELGSVDRSRIAQIDLNTFPRKDTVISLSDRNLNNVLWLCNVRTGDVQMWHLTKDGSLKGETPIATSIDLRERNP